MEMHQLRYVVAVARTRNFSRAAEQCHVSQPSLSQQILKLEQELGERLFDRMQRDVKMTAHGEAFLPHAARILEEVETAKREASDAKDLVRGAVTVGVLPTIAPYLLPKVLRPFRKEYPGIEIVVHEDVTARLLNLLTACELDLAIASLPIDDARIHAEALFTEELRVALPPNHPLLRKPVIRAADLRSERFILMKEGHCLGDQVLDFCTRRDLRPSVLCRSAQIETVRALVHAGMGIALIPAMACESERLSQARYRALAPPLPQRTVAVLWLKDRPPSRAATAFLQRLRIVTARSNEPERK